MPDTIVVSLMLTRVLNQSELTNNGSLAFLFLDLFTLAETGTRLPIR
jgi:hypothetical protein